MTEIAELPPGWRRAKLGPLLDDIQPGFASGRHNSQGEGLPHLRPMNVTSDGRIDLSVGKHIDPALADRATRRLRKGDVLFNNTNSPELVGKTALFDAEGEPAFSNRMTRVRPNPEALDPGYLARRLHFAWREGYFAERCNNHVSQASIGRVVLEEMEIEVPPVEVQRSIVKLLFDLEKRRMGALAQLRASTEAIDRLRQAVLAAACSGRLTADWRERGSHQSPFQSSEDLLASASVVNKSGSNLEPDMVGDVPDGWVLARLGLLIERIEAGKSFNALPRPAELDEWGVVKVSAMSWGTFRERENKAVPATVMPNQAFEIRPGGLLISRANTVDLVGTTVLVGETRPRLLLSDKSLRLVTRSGVDKRWLSLVLSSSSVRLQFSDQATGTSDSMRNLSQEKILATRVAVPTAKEQQEIAARVQRLFGMADQLLIKVRGSQRQVEHLTQALLAQAFRGTLLDLGSRMAV